MLVSSASFLISKLFFAANVSRMDPLLKLIRENAAWKPAELAAMLSSCHHGTVADCRIVEVLSDHDECIQEH